MAKEKEPRKITDTELQLIEDMTAAGLTIGQMAENFGLSEGDLQKWLNSHTDIKAARRRGEERFKLEASDSARRERLLRDASWFKPTEDELIAVEKLCELGWSEVKLAEQYGVSWSTWYQAKLKYPALQEAIDRGNAASNGKKLGYEERGWRPLPEDLEQITQLAAQGYTLSKIALELGQRVEALSSSKIPEVMEAYKAGVALAVGEATSELMKQVRKGNTVAIIYFLKARAKETWSDTAPKSIEIKQELGGTTVNAEIPKPVSNLIDFESESNQFRKEREKRHEQTLKELNGEG